MSAKKIKVLGVGSPILDILVNVDDSFITSIKAAKGGMELTDAASIEGILGKLKGRTSVAPGGSSANTVFGLAQLGVPTAFLGKTGDDKQAALYKNTYERMGGDLSMFKLNGKVATGRCLSMITPDSERTMRTDLGAAATLVPEDITDADFKGITHVHAEGYLLFNEKLTRAILEHAGKNNCTVSLDLSSFGVVNACKGILAELLEKYVDIVFANEDEAKAFCGSDDPEKALEVLSGLCSTVAVKLGKKGAILRSSGKTAKVDAELVKAVDTTGAGDLWQAGFLYGFLNGRALEDCGRFGSILGAEVVQVVGAAIPEKRWLEIRKRIAG
ncbi:MAG TPA: adenosine kinase [Lentisphaeria bacterium]|nr:adenosine kinase [Lentisphaeria bacterium]